MASQVWCVIFQTAIQTSFGYVVSYYFPTFVLLVFSREYGNNKNKSILMRKQMGIHTVFIFLKKGKPCPFPPIHMLHIIPRSTLAPFLEIHEKRVPGETGRNKHR